MHLNVTKRNIFEGKYRPIFGPDPISQSCNLDLDVTLVELLDIAVVRCVHLVDFLNKLQQVKLTCRFKILLGEVNRYHLGYCHVADLGVLLQPSEEPLHVFASSSDYQKSAPVAGSEPLRGL